MKLIDVTKKYWTRAYDLEVRVYCTDGDGDFPVHGAMCSGGRWVPKSWMKDGKATRNDEDPYDLVEVPDPAYVWLNVYEDGDVAVWLTKRQAVGSMVVGDAKLMGRVCLDVTKFYGRFDEEEPA